MKTPINTRTRDTNNCKYNKSMCKDDGCSDDSSSDDSSSDDNSSDDSNDSGSSSDDSSSDNSDDDDTDAKTAASDTKGVIPQKETGVFGVEVGENLAGRLSALALFETGHHGWHGGARADRGGLQQPAHPSLLIVSAHDIKQVHRKLVTARAVDPVASDTGLPGQLTRKAPRLDIDDCGAR